MAVPLEQPRGVIALNEGADHLPCFVERREVVQIEALLLQRLEPTRIASLRIGPGSGASPYARAAGCHSVAGGLEGNARNGASVGDRS